MKSAKLLNKKSHGGRAHISAATGWKRAHGKGQFSHKHMEGGAPRVNRAVALVSAAFAGEADTTRNVGARQTTCGTCHTLTRLAGALTILSVP